MSRRGTLGRHWRVVDRRLIQRFQRSDDGTDSIEMELEARPNGASHKCGGKVVSWRHLGADYAWCAKCSAEVAS